MTSRGRVLIMQTRDHLQESEVGGRMRSRLATRLPSRQVEMLTAGNDPGRGDVIVVIVEREDPLRQELPPRVGRRAGRAPVTSNAAMGVAKLEAARKNNARVIWALLDGATIPLRWAAAIAISDREVRIAGISFNGMWTN
jgi:hypothetical protein